MSCNEGRKKSVIKNTYFYVNITVARVGWEVPVKSKECFEMIFAFTFFFYFNYLYVFLDVSKIS